MKLHPGKGMSMVCTGDVIEFVSAAWKDIVYYYDEEEVSGKRLIHALVDEDTTLTWCEEEDKHSCQAVSTLAYKQGELRISIVVAPHGCKIEIREWFSNDH